MEKRVGCVRCVKRPFPSWSNQPSGRRNVLNEQQPEHEQKEMIMQNMRRIFLPYALMNMHDGCFLLVNRNYKPLGPEVRIKGLTAARAEKIGLKVGEGWQFM